jgi:hypothetical protein
LHVETVVEDAVEDGGGRSTRIRRRM